MLQIKNFLCYVVKEKFRHSFVLPKKYSVREINNFPKRYILTVIQELFVVVCKLIPVIKSHMKIH